MKLLLWFCFSLSLRQIYCSNPDVTVFSSVQNIISTLRDGCPSTIKFHGIDDDQLQNGPNSLDASALKLSTLNKLKEAEILITEPEILRKILEFDSNALPNLKWCQSTFAGVDTVFKSNLLLSQKSSIETGEPPFFFVLTRFSGSFGPLIAEWCIGRIIAHERRFYLTYENQSQKSWENGLKSLKNYRQLNEMTLVVLGGCGEIGSCIAKMAKFGFGMKTISYTKNKRKELPEGVDISTTDLNFALQKADYIVSVLPSTPSTKDLLSGAVLRCTSLEQGGKKPILINVGRGDVIDEDSIINALDQGFLSGAILDVFENEPLEPTSKLWERKDVIVSPHISGITRAVDIPKTFMKNYIRYKQGLELLYVVDWGKGY